MDLTPLHVAAEKNSADVAELLVRSGADVNARNEVGDAFFSPLCISLPLL